MKCLAVCVFLFSLPAFAVEYNIGVVGNTGFGMSRWSGEFRNFANVIITDHLDSRQPVYQVGLGLSIWLTERIGVHTGLQYGWYNYKYTYSSASGTIESEWKYTNVLLPVDLMYGIQVGRNRLAIGAGFSVCRQLRGTMPGLEFHVDIPDSFLETTIGPEVLLGYEIQSGCVRVFPSFRYIYSIDGLSDRLLPVGDNISKHYFLLDLGLFYSL